MKHESTKSQLRTELITRRAALGNPQFALENILGEVRKPLITKPYLNVFCYLSTPEEAPTWTLVEFLLKDPAIIAACPKIIDKITMRAAELRDLDNLQSGPLGIYTSPSTNWLCEAVDIVIVPGLAFTRAGARLGYGGGYYDRWFERNPNNFRIGFCYEAQIVDHLPIEAHDISMHAIVTESAVYPCSPVSAE
ncbi:MAG: 5-formyltetrahydrofolate cyclo-ligase [Pseudomonadota bacterium]